MLSLVALAGAAALVIWIPPEHRSAFGGAFVLDHFARVMKLLAIFGSAVTLVLSHNFMKSAGMARFEYPVLILLATTGMLMLISANDLIALYMGLELQSLALYVVAAFDRDNARSSEAGLKYFVLGALSSGMLLYGASLIYGTAGSTNFDTIAAERHRRERRPRPHLRYRIPHRRPCVQGVGGALPYVDARRIRRLADAGHGVLRRGAQGRRNGAYSCAP